MQNDIQTLLNSTQVEDRKQAIKLLIQQGGEEAMFQLAMLFKYDPDPDIRHLAVQAGKFLKQQSGGQSAVTTQEVRAVFGAQPELPGTQRPPTQPDRRTQEMKPPTASSRATQEAKPPTAPRRTQELRAAAADASRATQENRPATQPDRRTQEMKPPTASSRATQEAKPPTASSRATQEAKPPTASRRATQEFRPLTPPPAPVDDFDDEIALPGDEVPDYEYVPVSWQDEDKARGFVAAANMMYDEAKLKAAADYLRRALESNPNLRRDDNFVTTVARITERPRHLAMDLLINPPDRRTLTQEAKPVSQGWFGGGGGEKKKAVARTPGELTWGDVSIDLAIYTVVMLVSVLLGTWLIVQGLREPLNRAVAITGTFPRNMTPTLGVATVGQMVQVTHAFVSTITPGRTVVLAIVAAIYSLVTLVLQYVGIHLVATIPLVGVGSFKKLIRNFTWFNTILNVVTLIVTFAFINGLLTTLVAQINGGVIPPEGDLGAFVSGQMDAMISILCIAPVPLLLVAALIIANTYSFGVVRGCIALFLSVFVASALSGAVSAITSPLFALLLAL